MVIRKLTPAHNATQCGKSELASVRWYASQVDGMKGDEEVVLQSSKVEWRWQRCRLKGLLYLHSRNLGSKEVDR